MNIIVLQDIGWWQYFGLLNPISNILNFSLTVNFPQILVLKDLDPDLILIKWIGSQRLFLVLVLLHPMAQVGPLRMCPAPVVVSPHSVFLFLAILGVLHHGLSVFIVRIFETVHCFRPFYVTRDHVPCIHDSVREEISPCFQYRCLWPQVQRVRRSSGCWSMWICLFKE